MIFVATMNTEHFEFLAAGATEEEAISAMVQTMRRHRSQAGEAWDPAGYPVGADLDAPHPEAYDDPAQGDYEWLRWLARHYYCMRVERVPIGGPGLRDGEPIRLKGAER